MNFAEKYVIATKEQEHEALEKIKNNIERLGENSRTTVKKLYDENEALKKKVAFLETELEKEHGWKPYENSNNELIKRFDTLADDIRELLLDYVSRSKSKTVMLMKPTEMAITLSPDDTDIKNGLGIILEKDVPDYEIRAFLHPLDNTYHAYVPELDGFPSPVTGESLEECIMHTEKAILEYLEQHPDAPEPKRRR